MNEIKDFECIEIKYPEDDFNNFVIVRYDWPCNIQKITEVVSQFRNEKVVCIIGAPRKEYINWWEDDNEYDKYFAFMNLFDFCCSHVINDCLLEDLKEACVLSTEGYAHGGAKAWLTLKDEKSVCFFNMITAEGESFSDITTSVINHIQAAKSSNKKYRIDKIITTVISNTEIVSILVRNLAFEKSHLPSCC
ncbi:MAG: hypothetical protein K5829_08375 [Treponema sp.]|nr:hypothetical protein [Treponema sp.]